MKLAHRIVATTLTTTAFLGFIGAGAAIADDGTGGGRSGLTVASTDPAPLSVADGEMSAESTRQFRLMNLSGYTLQVDHFTAQGRKDNSELPADGTIVEPGHDLPLEVTYYFFGDNRFNGTFNVLDSEGRAIGQIYVKFKLDGLADPFTEVARQSGPVAAAAGRWNVAVTDLDVHTYTVGADQPELQHEILNNYCRNEGPATCTYKVTNEEATYGNPHPIGQVITNNTNKDGTLSVSKKDTVATTNAFSLSSTIKENVLNIVDISVQASYQHQVVRTHEFSVTTTTVVEAHTKTWIEVAEPVLRYTGDFTIKAGKSTWELKGVTIDTPDPDEDRVPNVHWQAEPLTPKEQAQAPKMIVETDIPAADMVGRA